MKNEFTLAFNEVLEEKGLPSEVVLEALEAALASAYRRHVNASNAQHVDAKIDLETGCVTIFAEKEIVEDVEDPRTEVTLSDAINVEAEASLGDMVIIESTPDNFGRVAAQTARQVIQQRIREAERDAQLDHYSKQIGEIVSGVVQALNVQGVTLGLDMKAEGIMPRAHQIQGERFRVHDRVRALLLEVKSTPRGPQILLSRAHRNFLRRLLENEVPEIYHGMVEIRSIAREPGHRSKVAVVALQAGVDPVGACVGIRGVRIQAIVRELNDEKIDVIEWSSDAAVYIAKALSPARVAGVYLLEPLKGTKTATVVVPEDQLSLAIGRDGQNARLAAKLTSWRIDIKSLPEAATDALYKLQKDPEFASLADKETDSYVQVETILAKKAEGRPVTPEEYHVLTQFVDRVENGLIRQREEEFKAEEERQRIARANIPSKAFGIPLTDFEISDRVYAVISETSLLTVGELMVQLELDPDSIWRLGGMGPKAMAELEKALEKLLDQLKAEKEKQIELERLEAVIEVEADQLEASEIAEAALDTEAVTKEEEIDGEELSADVEISELGDEEVTKDEVAIAQPGDVSVEEETPIAEEEVAVEEVEIASDLEPEAEGTGEETESLDELFALSPDILDFEDIDDDEDDDEEIDRKRKKKKKKKKKFIELEYDPDQDIVLMKKTRKRDGSDWEDGV